MGEKRLKHFFLALLYGHAVEHVILSIFHQALISIVQQTRMAFDLEIDNPSPLLVVPDKVT